MVVRIPLYPGVLIALPGLVYLFSIFILVPVLIVTFGKFYAAWVLYPTLILFLEPNEFYMPEVVVGLP